MTVEQEMSSSDREHDQYDEETEYEQDTDAGETMFCEEDIDEEIEAGEDEGHGPIIIDATGGTA